MTHPLTFTGHARAMLRERGIDRGWVERVVQTPEWTEPDPGDPTVTRAFGLRSTAAGLSGLSIRRRHGPAYYHRLLRPHAPQRSTRRAIMKVRFDQEADALYIRLDDAKVVESEEVKPGLVLDFDADGRVVGFELLNAGRQLPAAQLRQIQFEVA